MSEQELLKKIVDFPIESYEDFTERFKKYGQMAPFPEFKESVLFLINELRSDYVVNIIKKHPVLQYELNEVLTFLLHCNLSFDVNDCEYPYATPFDAPYPYRPTIDAIENAIRLLDKVNRLDPQNKAVKLYHFDRYCYHRHALVASQEVVLIPITLELSMVDFIKTRAVPIEFIGIIAKTMRVDGHYQSPLDFWYHDFNHARRLFAYIRKRLKEKGVTKEEEIFAYYREVNNFITTVILKKFVEIKVDATEEERARTLLATMIIFEIVHETALTLERDSLIADLIRPNGPQPFEYMKTPSLDCKGDVEALRTPTGNIESGASFRFSRPEDTVEVRYFLDAASIGLLANIYAKLTHFYYDDSGDVREGNVAEQFRTPEFLLKTVKYIFDVLEYKDCPTDEEILNLITNREGTKERFFIKGLDQEDGQFATEPLKADEAIILIGELNKKVYTFFGYSALGYEDIDTVRRVVRKELEQLNKEEYVIAVGATEEGIGFVYEIAKELGFLTIGIVSTQALSYSGKFSEDVDRIYIINDDYWGGFIPGTKKLAETTKAFLGVSAIVSAYGGGENTAVMLQEAKKLSIPVIFTEAEMNHEKARKVYGEVYDSFKGKAHQVWQVLQ